MKGASYLITVCLIVCSSAFSGCSIVGLALGAAIDGKHNDNTIIPIERIYQLKPDDDVIVKMLNGLESDGSFAGIDTMSVEQYEISYDIARRIISNCFLPLLHEHVNVAFDSIRGIRGFSGEFFGFDERGIRVRKDSSCCPASFPFRNIYSITSETGNKLSNPELVKLFEDRRLPSCTIVNLRTMYGMQAIMTDEISNIEVKGREEEKSNMTRTLATVGLAVDVILVMIIFKVDISPWFFN